MLTRGVEKDVVLIHDEIGMSRHDWMFTIQYIHITWCGREINHGSLFQRDWASICRVRGIGIPCCHDNSWRCHDNNRVLYKHLKTVTVSEQGGFQYIRQVVVAWSLGRYLMLGVVIWTPIMTLLSHFAKNQWPLISQHSKHLPTFTSSHQHLISRTWSTIWSDTMDY